MGNTSHQHMQNQEMRLVLTSDAKPRLKWTADLHQRFVDAVAQLGGAEKATPKGLMRVMSIPGLTLYHLKSHLQKYRLGKSQQLDAHNDPKQQVCKVNQRRDSNLSGEVCNETQNQNQMDGSLQITRALQMQMEVQRKLSEQIEVQRHLQLRIEAQGKYLQSVLKKAQETLVGYGSSSVGLEAAKAELSQLASMVDNGCSSSLVSVLTDIGGSVLKDSEKSPMGGTKSSLESSLTSFESCGKKEEEQTKQESIVLSLVPSTEENHVAASSNPMSGRKRSGSTISDANCDENQFGKRLPTCLNGGGDQLRKIVSAGTFDLNTQCLADFDSGVKAMDLN